MTTLYVDADACPVTKEVLAAGRTHKIPVVLVGNTTQNLARHAGRAGVEVVEVGAGQDVADFAIISRLQPEDIVVTGDLGLAAMVLGRGARALAFRGREYMPETIDLELAVRHAEQVHRRRGGRTRGPSPLEDEDREHFAHTLKRVLEGLR